MYHEKALRAERAMMRRHAQHFELNVEVKKEEVLKSLNANKEKHLEEFKKAVENYQVKARTSLQERLEVFERGDFTEDTIPHLGFDISPPENFVDTYDSVIAMIEASADEVITLSRQNFLMFIEDVWDWSDHFEYLNSTYAV